MSLFLGVLFFVFNFSPYRSHNRRESGDFVDNIDNGFAMSPAIVEIHDFNKDMSDLRLKNSRMKAQNAVEAGNLSFDQLRSGKFPPFNIDGSDVIVFLHVQKTAGTTFERYLVRQLEIPQPCQCRAGRKKCQCRRTDGRGFWLFSRFSTGWSCGLHADWTELVQSGCVNEVLNRREHREDIKKKGWTSALECVPAAVLLIIPYRSANPARARPAYRRYFLTTFLREPIARYLSEFRHMNRGATWSASKHLCLDRYPTYEELPPCFDPALGWTGVTFDDFVACKSNLASNRQTRMLADLSLVGCYNRTYFKSEVERGRKLLDSAKANLLKMAFFGLQEDMRRSQYVFERTFNLQFNKVLLNWNETTNLNDFTSRQVEIARRLNHLDLQLYQFAKHLFDQRFEELKNDDPLFILNIAS
uniref:Heparan-sulfate 6-O-sulfotransferase n=1 Tax=Romanomermis culicivorax TaxID=13658 RepID=A0A915JLA7_ROMCU